MGPRGFMQYVVMLGQMLPTLGKLQPEVWGGKREEYRPWDQHMSARNPAGISCLVLRLPRIRLIFIFSGRFGNATHVTVPYGEDPGWSAMPCSNIRGCGAFVSCDPGSSSESIQAQAPSSK